MRSSFAKSIYVGAAVLGLAGLSAVTTTTASAKSYATAGSYTALTKGQNVLVNGTHAIYSKPGTVKGAKVVASKKTVAKLAASKKSNDTFYAYGTKTTNRGSVYYKIVTMDKKYRGYIYGGKTAGAFAGGIKTTDTLTTVANPVRTTGYYLKDISKHTLWTAPKNTDIHAKKVSLYGVAKTDPFTVDKAATKTKEGSLYYHVTDSKNSSISGWIYAGKGYDTNKQDLGGLTLSFSDVALTNDNSVTVVYNGTGSKAVFVSTDKDAKAGKLVAKYAKNAAGQTLSEFVKSSAPAGYRVVGAYTNGAQYGNNVYVNVTEAATSKVQLRVDSVENNKVAIAHPLVAGDKLTAKDISSINMNAALLSGDKGTAYTQHELNVIAISLNGQKAKTIEGTVPYYASNGTVYHYEFSLNWRAFASDNRMAQYGDTLVASYKANLVKGAPKTSTYNTDWIA
ncbi:S-layer protein [Levilactobacillus brevis]|uniref:S-layer protein n=1 Tax=Levilactobacillus brevis TaxID=1580 RepID=UPI001C1F0C0E|nr:S-layer protein [Levilactobacillus brevis]MBU7558899.1 S-layer protein [Levilactobacillus brevis]MCE6010509.1 S-layer protein [Levilactobacillus brevis]MCE6025070.1 S-layer protein [Levilactobacillus brevis]MCE6035829.1 S-layer protein [Levilactobacillus brevis]